jgi:hypothetical protein
LEPEAFVAVLETDLFAGRVVVDILGFDLRTGASAGLDIFSWYFATCGDVILHSSLRFPDMLRFAG